MKNLLKVINREEIYGAGVYCLKNVETGEVLLIGSGIQCNDRLSWYIYNFKRNLFKGTNKEPLIAIYDRGSLGFEMLHVSNHNAEIKNMTDNEKESLQIALGVMEKMYIDLYKDTIVNKQMTVKKHSSNKNKYSTYKRRMSNLGEKNPRCKYDEELIQNILWLKMNGYKPKDIEELLKNNGYNIKSNYISMIGLSKWIHAIPVKPHWIA